MGGHQPGHPGPPLGPGPEELGDRGLALRSSSEVAGAWPVADRGHVAAVGDGVDSAWTGRPVVARTGPHGGSGGYSERALVPASRLVAVPEGADPVQRRRAVTIQARESNQTPLSLMRAASISRSRPSARAAAAGSRPRLREPVLDGVKPGPFGQPFSLSTHSPAAASRPWAVASTAWRRFARHATRCCRPA